MKLVIHNMEKAELPGYVATQLFHFFPSAVKGEQEILAEGMTETLTRLTNCFSKINHANYSDTDGGARLDIANTDQYCSLLYLWSNVIHSIAPHHLTAQRLFALNKALHGFHCMYDNKLPKVFWIIHAVGTVVGRADFGDNLVIRQGCTVGALAGKYPKLGDGFIMSAGSSVIGACEVGENVMLGPDACVFKQNIESDSLVQGHYQHGQKITKMNRNALGVHFRVT